MTTSGIQLDGRKTQGYQEPVGSLEDRGLYRGFQNRPLLIPGVMALIGATYPSRAALVSFLFLAAIACILLPRLLSIRCHASRTRHQVRLPAVLLACTFFVTGTQMGLYWTGQINTSDQISELRVQVRVALIPLEPPATSRRSDGFTDFPAWIYRTEVLDLGSHTQTRGASSHFPDTQSISRFLTGKLVRVLAQVPEDLGAIGPNLLCLPSELWVTGVLKAPDYPSNPGEFDYRLYLHGKKIFLELRGCIQDASQQFDSTNSTKNAGFVSHLDNPDCAGGGAGWWHYVCKRQWYLFLLRARLAVLTSVYRTFPQPEARLMQRVIFGDSCKNFQDALDSCDIDALRRTGLYRFLSATGFHIDAAYTICEKVLRKITKRPSLSRIASLASASSLCILSGGAPGMIRPMVCAALRTLAPEFRMRYDSVQACLLSGILSSCLVPFPLRQAGIIAGQAAAIGAWAGGRYGFCSRGWVRRIQRAAGIFIFSLPVASCVFGEIYPLSFAAEFLWAAPAWLILPVSAMALAHPALGTVVGWIPFAFLRGCRVVSQHVASLPWTSLVLPYPGACAVAGYCSLLGVLALSSEFSMRRLSLQRHSGMSCPPRSLRVYAAVVLCASIMFLGVTTHFYPPWPEITFLSVGQGDCAVIRYRGMVLLIDTGTRAAFLEKVAPFLRRNGISRIDLCVLSHSHKDHAGGFLPLCAEFKVNAVAIGKGQKAQVENWLMALPGAHRGNRPSIVDVAPGKTYQLNRVFLRVAWGSPGPAQSENSGYAPDPVRSLGSSGTDGGNQYSLVLTAWFEGVWLTRRASSVAIEFWGDAPADVVASVVDEVRSSHGSGSGESHGGASGIRPGTDSGTSARIIKVPHHGSKGSLVPGFYKDLPGSHAVVSVGPNAYGHPSPEVLESAASGGVVTWRTDLDGAISVRIGPGWLWVSPFRKTGGQKVSEASR